MNKTLIALLLIPFSLSSMEENIANEIVPCIQLGLRYNLTAHQNCTDKGIPSKENDPFIHLDIYQGTQEHTRLLSVPLPMLLDEKGTVKKEIALPCYENKLFKIVNPQLLQAHLVTIVIDFNRMYRAYYSYEKKELIKKNILQEKDGKVTHVNGGYELPSLKELDDLYGNSLIDSASSIEEININNNKITIQSKWVIGLGTLGLIGFLIWLYKK